MPDLLIASSVAELLGEEQVGRLRRYPAIGVGTCFDCHRSIDASTQDLAAVVVLSDPRIIELELLALTHARCSASELRMLDVDQTVALLETANDASVSAMARLWPGDGSGPDRPVLFVSLHTELSIRTEAGERVDILSARFLGRGWDQVHDLEVAPAHQPSAQETMCRATMYPEAAPSGLPHFRLHLVDGATIVADIESLEAPDAWIELAWRTGHVDVYIGPLSVHQWLEQPDRDVIVQAMRAGSLVGATVVTELVS